MQSGIKLEYSLDTFCVVTASHVVAIFNDTWATYVLYLIPSYIVFKLLMLLKDYLKSRSDAAMNAEPEDDLQKSKRDAKKER